MPHGCANKFIFMQQVGMRIFGAFEYESRGKSKHIAVLFSLLSGYGNQCRDSINDKKKIVELGS